MVRKWWIMIGTSHKFNRWEMGQARPTPLPTSEFVRCDVVGAIMHCIVLAHNTELRNYSQAHKPSDWMYASVYMK